MRRKLDHLPRGVRWAVRLLRIAGTVLTVGLFLFIPFFLLFWGIMLSESGSPWIFDLLSIVAALPIAIGSAMRVTATCMEMGHDPSSFDSDYEVEWKKFVSACLNTLSVIFVFGGVHSLIQLLTALRGKNPVIEMHAINLALHLLLIGTLYRGAYFLDRWFERRRHAARLH
jgi:hypothetical protein